MKSRYFRSPYSTSPGVKMMQEIVTKCHNFNPYNVMVMPWERPNPFKPLKMQDSASFKTRLLEHNANLDVESPLGPALLTKIMCTIGENSLEPNIFGRMIAQGMALARIDMGIGTRTGALDIIRRTRECAVEYSSSIQRVAPIAIVAELKGPQILTGALHEVEEIVLDDGDTINLTTNPAFDVKGTKTCIFVDHKELAFVLKPKDKILLNYGRVSLSVRGCYDNEIVCEVITGGTLRSYADVTVIDVPLNIPYLTDKDKKDIEVLTAEEVDVLIVPRVEDRKCLEEVRKVIGVRRTCIQLIAKIDTKLGYRNFGELLETADGVIVDRGRLSVEMSTEKVMQAQKTMIAKANQAGKPAFVVCEYLNSMITRNCPTFAEATDVINAILEGADGLTLCDETARGLYPALTVRTLCTLCREAEAQTWTTDTWTTLIEKASPPVDPAIAVVISAVEAAHKAHATAIVVTTTSGTSAKFIASFRPRCPIIAVTRYGSVARKLQMYRAVWPLHYIVAPNPNWCLDVDLRLQFAINAAKGIDLVKPGDPLVLVSGWRQGAGFTNNIRIVYASQEEPWVLPYSPVVVP